MNSVIHNDNVLSKYVNNSHITYINFNFPGYLENLSSCDTLVHGPKDMMHMRPYFWKRQKITLPGEVDHIIIKSSWEGTWTTDFISKWRQDVESVFEVKTTLLTQNEYASTQLDNVGYLHRCWLDTSWIWFPNQRFINYQSDKFHVDTKPAYIFNFIIGTERPDKVNIYNKLKNKNMLSNGKCIYVATDRTNNFTEIPRVNLTLKDIMSGVPKQLTYNYDKMDDIKKIERFRALYCLINSRFSLVIETEMKNHTNRYTEKTLKPISIGQPFIVAGNYRCLDLLKKDGFKTFSPYIDETYDKVRDSDKRIDLICDELERLCNITTNEWEELLAQVKPIIEHNKRHYVNLSNRYIDDLFEYIV